MIDADLLAGARSGDGEAFRELVQPHRRELQVHCYPVLGSLAGSPLGSGYAAWFAL